MHRTDVLMKSCNGSPPEARGLRVLLPARVIHHITASNRTGSTDWFRESADSLEAGVSIWEFSFSSPLIPFFDCFVMFEIHSLAEPISGIPMKQSFPYSATLHHLASHLNTCISIELHTHAHTPHMHQLHTRDAA